MELKDVFNSGYTAAKLNDNVLGVSYSMAQGYNAYLAYDFAARVLLTRANGDGAFSVTPFSQLDRETLVNMREKLVELKGKPPELPAEAPVNPGNTRSLRP